MDQSTKSASARAEKIRDQILELVEEYTVAAHTLPPFEPGVTSIPVSGRVFNAHDVRFLVDSALDFWLTTGRFNDRFEKRLGDFLGVKGVSTTNSGSSANLLAISALTSPLLDDRALKPGDEVITVAAAFPTTVNPILLNGLIAVFVDIDFPTYNVSACEIEAAVTDKTRAIVLAHTLGNPFDLSTVTQIAKKYNLWLIEDCCDALGSTYAGAKVGTFGDIGTLSFYPAHHITMGEGGATFARNPKLKRIIESFRDWGRDCYCDPGKVNTCGKRFDWQLGSLPKGYDHKYVYSHLGYNLKITDMQAAVGLAQLDHLESFIEARKKNFEFMKLRLDKLQDYFILPEATPNSSPAWFGFPISLRENAPFLREDLLRYLSEHKVGTRLLFGGNIVHQPYFKNRKYRVSGMLKNTDFVMKNTFWLGVYPRLTEEMMDYTVSRIEDFVKGAR